MKKSIIVILLIVTCLSSMGMSVFAGCAETASGGYVLVGTADITGPYIAPSYCEATCSWYEFWKEANLFEGHTTWQCTYYRSSDGSYYNTTTTDTYITQAGCC